MKQETKVAPASAASRAWPAEKTSVMFTGMPLEVSSLVAASPAGEKGTLTTTRGSISARARPSASIPAVSVETTSTEVGPSTSSQIRRTISPGSPSSLASRVGLVVAPERTPHSATSSTSDTAPVSMNSFT